MSVESVVPSNHLILDSPFSAPQFSAAPGSFPLSQLLASDSQSFGASGSASILPMSIQGWFPLGLTGLISLLSRGLSRVQQRNSEALILWCLAFFMVQLTHPHMNTGKTVALTIWTFVSKVMSLLLNIRWTNIWDYLNMYCDYDCIWLFFLFQTGEL